MHAIRYKGLCFLVIALLLSACTSSDMQGEDPHAYLTQHAKVARVESANDLRDFTFEAHAATLDDVQENAVRAYIDEAGAMAIHKAIITLSSKSPYPSERALRVKRLLRSTGLTHDAISIAKDGEMKPDSFTITVHYAIAFTPDCPDWRKSSHINYSNTVDSNFGCATAINRAHMVANPRDLEQGSAHPPAPSVERNSAVIGGYYSGGAAASSNSGANGDGN